MSVARNIKMPAAFISPSTSPHPSPPKRLLRWKCLLKELLRTMNYSLRNTVTCFNSSASLHHLIQSTFQSTQNNVPSNALNRVSHTCSLWVLFFFFFFVSRNVLTRYVTTFKQEGYTRLVTTTNGRKCTKTCTWSCCNCRRCR